MSVEVLLKVFMLCGGLAFFLYGMNVMSSGLTKLAGGSLERSLKRMTSNRFKAMALGAGITIAIQSSSAMTVMLVGLVNSGIMQLGQTIGVIMGSNVGTTLTPWIFSLSGVDGSGWLALLKPENFSPIVALIGIILIMMSKKQRRKDIGKILIGFSVLMYGMTLMGDSVDGLDRSPAFASILTAFENPLLGVVVGAVFTGVIQSSAASVGMLQTLAMTGSISYGIAIPIIMGQNIGTCVTALLSAIGVSKNAKKVSVVHISFNLIGTIACLILFFGADALFSFSFTDRSIGPAGIALCHTIFNISTTAMLCPFTRQIEKLANAVIHPSKKERGGAFLDERLLVSPGVAVNEAEAMTRKMAVLAQQSVNAALDLVEVYSEKAAQEIEKNETELDSYEDKLGSFLARLAERSMSAGDSRRASKLLHSIGDFERLGDHALNLVAAAAEIHDKQIVFSEQAQRELHNLRDALQKILSLTIACFAEDDLAVAQRVEPLEQVIDALIAKAKNGHIERVMQGKCTIQTGFVHADLLTNYERISDHCSNIAVSVIEGASGSFDSHRYLNEVKRSGSNNFSEYFSQYAEQYGVF